MNPWYDRQSRAPSGSGIHSSSRPGLVPATIQTVPDISQVYDYLHLGVVFAILIWILFSSLGDPRDLGGEAFLPSFAGMAPLAVKLFHRSSFPALALPRCRE